MTKRLQRRLKELLNYNPKTGVFTWRHGGHGVLAGDAAGSKNKKGRRQIRFNGRRHSANRLAFLWMTGRWPKRQIDHEDVVLSNDRWNNLREATPSQNGANKKRASNNTSGFKGVSFHQATGKYQACIRKNYRRKYLGVFVTAEMAHAAYKSAAVEMFGKFARCK